VSQFSPHVEKAKRILLRQFCDDNEIPFLCKEHTTCLRWAIQRAGIEIPKELK